MICWGCTLPLTQWLLEITPHHTTYRCKDIIIEASDAYLFSLIMTASLQCFATLERHIWQKQKCSFSVQLRCLTLMQITLFPLTGDKTALKRAGSPQSEASALLNRSRFLPEKVSSVPLDSEGLLANASEKSSLLSKYVCRCSSLFLWKGLHKSCKVKDSLWLHQGKSAVYVCSWWAVCSLDSLAGVLCTEIPNI